jgi:hypothetical protein
MQNETQNQDTNTQVTQEESPAQNETPQNQDIDPAVTMSSDDLVGWDPNVTMRPEDLLGPEPAQEPNPNVTMHPEDLLDPEPAEEPVIDDWGLGRPSGPEPISFLDRPPEPSEGPETIGFLDNYLDRPPEPPQTISFLDRPPEPSEGPETIDLAAPSAEEAGRIDDSDPDIQGGCAFDYEYDESVGACTPSYEDFNFIPIFYGDKPLPDTAGGYVALPGEAGGDLLLGLGGSISGFGGIVEKGLDWYGEDGGPIGWGFQQLGHTIGYATGAAGTIVSGAGEVVGGVSEGVGDAVDAVGDAAEDVWDEVSSWW